VAEFELRFLLTVLVSPGFLAEHAGLHAAVVAFAAGLLLSEVVEEHEALEEELEGIVFSFLAPVFFLNAGTQIRLDRLDLGTVRTTGVLFAAAVGLKYFGTSMAARWLQPELGHFAGVLFNYRLTFGIITASVGLEEDVLVERLFTAMLPVVLASALLPVIFLRELHCESA
jgi:Kef-type K+ transport system membrane component KefB